MNWSELCSCNKILHIQLVTECELASRCLEIVVTGFGFTSTVPYLFPIFLQ